MNMIDSGVRQKTNVMEHTKHGGIVIIAMISTVTIKVNMVVMK